MSCRQTLAAHLSLGERGRTPRASASRLARGAARRVAARRSVAGRPTRVPSRVGPCYTAGGPRRSAAARARSEGTSDSTPAGPQRAPPAAPAEPRDDAAIPASQGAAERVELVRIGLVAVLIACLLFAPLRLAGTLLEGRATPWWGNAVGAVVMGATLVWFRRRPAARSKVAVHLTAGTAIALLVLPVAYGMSSSAWWLSLVAFAMVLMGERFEAWLWGVLAVVSLGVVTVVEPLIQVAAATPEPLAEVLASRLAFIVVLGIIAWSFRRETERKARELREVAAALGRANRVKSRFLAHMSHEVRTPLHGAIASMSMALEEPLSDTVRHHLDVSLQSARGLLTLLNNILEVARGEADALEIATQRFDLHGTLAEVLTPLAALARQRGLDFSAEAEDGLSARRLGDGLRVGQVVQNLVQNAVKFTPSGTVRVRLASASAADPARVAIIVEDTGVGIPEDRIADIFEPFTQLEGAPSGTPAGSGLGLAIVREFVRLMGGEIEVDSTPGRGSRFVVSLSLPLDGPPVAGPRRLVMATSAPPVARVTTRRLHVLVAEDHPINRLVLKAMLERSGHTVVDVGDGDEAFQRFVASPPDCVLSDIEMPVLDGIDFAARVRAWELERGHRRVPIIGVTAHVGPDERHRLLAAGMDDHLTKPFVIDDLRAVIARVLEASAPPSGTPSSQASS